MDLSKLPRLSQTEQTPQPGTEPQPGERTPTWPQPSTPTAVAGAEAWMNLVLAVVLIFFFPRIWQYFLFPNSFTWTFVDTQGAPLAYTKSAFFLVDMGVALFAIVLILDAVAILFSRSLILRGAALLITVLGAIFNFVALALTAGEIGVQFMPLIAGGYGIYIAIYQWKHLQAMLPSKVA